MKGLMKTTGDDRLFGVGRPRNGQNRSCRGHLYSHNTCKV